MSLIDFICERTWALEESTLGRLVALAERAGRAEVVQAPEVIAAVEANTQRRETVESERKAAADDDEIDPEEAAKITAIMCGSIAVVPVDGVIARHASMVNGFSQPGGTTGAAIAAAVKLCIDDPACSGVILDFDSPGGTVAGCEETAAAIRMMGEHKPIVSYAHGQMCSAAYWIGAQASKVYAGRTSPIGSIGVFSVYDDSSKAMSERGVTRHIVRSGANKGTMWPGVPVTEKALEAKQAECNATYAVMLTDIAAGRGVDVETLKPGADGRVLIGEQGLAAGLLDGVMPFEQVLAAMEEEYGTTTQRGFTPSAQSRKYAMSDKSPTAKSPAAPAPEAKALEAPIVTAPVAATFGELKAAFGGKAGGDTHIVECMDKGLTMTAAVMGWAGKLEAQLATQAEAAAKAPKAEEKSEAPKAPVSVSPVATFTANNDQKPGAGEPTTFAAAAAKAYIEVAAEFKGKGKSKGDLEAIATARACKTHPELHAKWRAEDFPALKIAG